MTIINLFISCSFSSCFVSTTPSEGARLNQVYGYIYCCYKCKCKFSNAFLGQYSGSTFQCKSCAWSLVGPVERRGGPHQLPRHAIVVGFERRAAPCHRRGRPGAVRDQEREEESSAPRAAAHLHSSPCSAPTQVAGATAGTTAPRLHRAARHVRVQSVQEGLHLPSGSRRAPCLPQESQGVFHRKAREQPHRSSTTRHRCALQGEGARVLHLPSSMSGRALGGHNQFHWLTIRTGDPTGAVAKVRINQ